MPEKEIIKINNNNKDTDIEKIYNKSIAQKNSEVLVDILETLEGLTDLMKDIHLNNLRIYKYVKEQQEIKTEPIKGSWFY
jgi:hypothetical protein